MNLIPTYNPERNLITRFPFGLKQLTILKGMSFQLRILKGISLQCFILGWSTLRSWKESHYHLQSWKESHYKVSFWAETTYNPERNLITRFPFGLKQLTILKEISLPLTILKGISLQGFLLGWNNLQSWKESQYKVSFSAETTYDPERNLIRRSFSNKPLNALIAISFTDQNRCTGWEIQ